MASKVAENLAPILPETGKKTRFGHKATRRRTAARPSRMIVEHYRGLTATPESALGLIDRERGTDFFRCRAWYEHFERQGLYPNTELQAFAVGDQASPHGLAIGIRRLAPLGLLKAEVIHFSHPDQAEFQAFVSPEAGNQGEIFDRVVGCLSDGRDRVDMIRTGTFDSRGPTIDEFRQILRRHGFLTQSYFVCANWYEEVGGATADQYLAARPKTLHDIVKRRAKRLQNQAAGQIQILHGGEQLAMGIADYARITAASWQGRDITARDYLPSLMKLAASLGVLRLGLIYVDGRPAGAQICFVSNGKASFYRTAFDPSFRRFSVGTLIIHDMVRHVIDVDKVELIDFGIGDQAYKQGWAGTRRELWGIAGFNRRSLAGLGNAVGHLGAGLVKSVLGRGTPPGKEVP